MNKAWLILVIFWVIVIAFPAIIAYLIWWLLVFIWLNIFLLTKGKNKTNFWQKNPSMDGFVKFGDYKIFRDKK